MTWLYNLFGYFIFVRIYCNYTFENLFIGCFIFIQIVVDLLKVDFYDISSAMTGIDRLAEDAYMKYVKQLLLEIPDTITTGNMEHILDKMEKIGFKKCRSNQFNFEKKKFYSVGLFNYHLA